MILEIYWENVIEPCQCAPVVITPITPPELTGGEFNDDFNDDFNIGS